MPRSGLAKSFASTGRGGIETLGGAQYRPLAYNLEYIIFLDDDDEFTPEHLASMLETAHTNDARAVVGGSTVHFDEYPPGTTLRTVVANAPDLRPLAVNDDLVQSVPCIALGAVMFEASLVRQLQIFRPEFSVASGWDYLMRAFARRDVCKHQQAHVHRACRNRIKPPTFGDRTEESFAALGCAL